MSNNVLRSLLEKFKVDADFFRKVAETLSTKIVTILIGVVTSVLIARLLGPEGRGIFAFATVLSGLGVQFGVLGLHSSNTYYVARDPNLMRVLIGNSLVVSLVLGIISAIVGLTGYVIWPQLLPIDFGLLITTLISIPLGIAYLLLQGLLLGNHQVRPYNTIEIVTRFLSTVLIILIGLLGFLTANSLMAVNVLILIVGVLIIFYWLQKAERGLPNLSYIVLRKCVDYGLRAYFVSLLAFVMVRINLLIVQYLLGVKQLGYYSIAVSMFDMIYTLPVSIGLILFPKLSSMKTTEEKWVYLRSVLKLVATLMIAISVIATFLASPVIKLLFGEEFLPALPAFYALMPGLVFWSLVSVLSSFVASITIPLSLMVVYLVLSIISAGMSYFFTIIWGLSGAGGALSICYFVGLLGLFYVANRVRIYKSPIN